MAVNCLAEQSSKSIRTHKKVGSDVHENAALEPTFYAIKACLHKLHDLKPGSNCFGFQ